MLTKHANLSKCVPIVKNNTNRLNKLEEYAMFSESMQLNPSQVTIVLTVDVIRTEIQQQFTNKIQ